MIKCHVHEYQVPNYFAVWISEQSSVCSDAAHTNKRFERIFGKTTAQLPHAHHRMTKDQNKSKQKRWFSLDNRWIIFQSPHPLFDKAQIHK